MSTYRQACKRRLKRRSWLRTVLLFAFALAAASCLQDKMLTPYKPVITFEGYFQDAWFELPGHFGVPNTCVLKHDTIEITCYCDTFDNSQHGMWNGVMVWIQILPFNVDTTCDFCTPHIRIRYSDFATGMSQNTFSVYPVDTTYGPTFSITADTVIVERKHGGRIHISNIAAPLHREGTYSLAGRIERGRLVGKVE